MHGLVGQVQVEWLLVERGLLLQDLRRRVRIGAGVEVNPLVKQGSPLEIGGTVPSSPLLRRSVLVSVTAPPTKCSFRTLLLLSTTRAVLYRVSSTELISRWPGMLAHRCIVFCSASRLQPLLLHCCAILTSRARPWKTCVEYPPLKLGPDQEDDSLDDKELVGLSMISSSPVISARRQRRSRLRLKWY